MLDLEGRLSGRLLLGRYRVDDVIGRGGMAIVYRGHDERLGRDVAVKVLDAARSDPARLPELRARFSREARVAAAVRHPNVVAVLDSGNDPEHHVDFLVLELLEGEDLATRLRRLGPPGIGSALTVLRQAAAGLAAGHRAGLVHRDVKPANLFIVAEPHHLDAQVRILDFGIAQTMEDADATLAYDEFERRPPLSPAFAAPEQLAGTPWLTPASDVFSLGAVAFYLLTGRRAFTARDAREAGEETARALEALEREEALPAPLLEWLRICLAYEPEVRYRDADALLEALDDTGLYDGAVPLTSRGDSGEPAPATSAPGKSRIRTTLGRLAAAAVAAAGWAAVLLLPPWAGATGTMIAAAVAPGLLMGFRAGFSLRFPVMATVAVTALMLLLLEGPPISAGGLTLLILMQLAVAGGSSWLSAPRGGAPHTADGAW